MPAARLSKNVHPVLGALLHATVSIDSKDRSWPSRVFITSLKAASVLFLVDTGATRTCLDNEIVTRLGLRKRDEYPVFTPATREAKLSPAYAASIQLQDENGNPHDFRALEVHAADFSIRPYKGLLGRDVLSRCHFHYDGPGKKFSLEF